MKGISAKAEYGLFTGMDPLTEVEEGREGAEVAGDVPGARNATQSHFLRLTA